MTRWCPHIHPTQRNEESFITQRQACTFLGQSKLLLLLMCVLSGFETACSEGGGCEAVGWDREVKSCILFWKTIVSLLVIMGVLLSFL